MTEATPVPGGFATDPSATPRARRPPRSPSSAGLSSRHYPGYTFIVDRR